MALKNAIIGIANIELSEYAKLSDLENKADKVELDNKANKDELYSKADRTELDNKVDKDDIPIFELNGTTLKINTK